MADHPEITLGSHTLPVYPQRHAYLTNRVGKFVERLVASGTSLEDISGAVALLGAGAYDLLAALVPNLPQRVPEYEFAGYGSKEAYEAGEYDEREDRSPTFPEILDAFQKAVEVNRFDVLTVLKDAVWGPIVDPKVVKRRVSLWIAESALTGSPSLLGTSGESPPSDSGTTPPTSDTSESSETTGPDESGSTPTTSG